MNIAKEVCISLLTDYFSTLGINEELWEEIPERARKVLTMNNNECVLYVLENYGIELDEFALSHMRKKVEEEIEAYQMDTGIYFKKLYLLDPNAAKSLLNYVPVEECLALIRRMNRAIRNGL